MLPREGKNPLRPADEGISQAHTKGRVLLRQRVINGHRCLLDHLPRSHLTRGSWDTEVLSNLYNVTQLMSVGGRSPDLRPVVAVIGLAGVPQASSEQTKENPKGPSPLLIKARWDGLLFANEALLLFVIAQASLNL